MGMSRSESGKLGYIKAKEALSKQRDEVSAAARANFIQKYCPNCGNGISFEKRGNTYCDHKCAAKVNNKIKQTNCKLCGKCCNWKSYASSDFCSSACFQAYKKKTKLDRWLSGEISGGSWHGVSPFVRQWLIITQGEACSECNWHERNPYTGKIPLQVDHINGNPLDHSSANLRLLCPSCHSLTPTFGGLNRGSGRSQRYEKQRSIRDVTEVEKIEAVKEQALKILGKYDTKCKSCGTSLDFNKNGLRVYCSKRCAALLSGFGTAQRCCTLKRGHGRVSTYKKAACRCELCVCAYTQYLEERKEARIVAKYFKYMAKDPHCPEGDRYGVYEAPNQALESLTGHQIQQSPGSIPGLGSVSGV